VKKVIVSIFLFVLTVISASSIFAFYDTPVKYNDNPDLSGKVVGSLKNDFLCRYRAETMEVLLEQADLIIEGEVVSDGTTKTEYFSLGDEAAEEKLEKMFPGKSAPAYNVTSSQIKVNRVLYGDVDTDTIELHQFGSAGSDNGETKVRKGRKMIFILRKHPDKENVYSSVDFEDGLFEVDEDNKLLSLSDNMLTAKYDGLDAKTLEKDISKALKKLKNS